MRKADDQVKQEVEEDEEKKNKIETLKLSLALPDVSLSLMASNTVKTEGKHRANGSGARAKEPTDLSTAGSDPSAMTALRSLEPYLQKSVEFFRLLLLPFRFTGLPGDGSVALWRLEEKVRRKR
ncbi:hypothetical protein IGI04_016470 [Brassica rapa subsp. trilocularis]|uniref:Uncharacterized protein n=1 Tax=Brassica rapa subsp. trilocularis TaxID=1813537 RepID=A0ABQ7MUC2_BRACM|nr:hypothetical protein IGI04_016470 [Brassica rapa subsp. trilocularis]